MAAKIPDPAALAAAAAGAVEPAEPPADLLPDAQVRLDRLLRRLDLVERRVAHREAALAGLKAEVEPAAQAALSVTDELARLDDVDARVARLERRGFGPSAGGAALDSARFEPAVGRAGDTVLLTCTLEGFSRGDTLTFTLEDVITDATSEPLSVVLDEDHPATVAVPWKVPAVPPGRNGAFRFTVRGREVSSRAPVFTVRG